jgi:hypothetical protein
MRLVVSREILMLFCLLSPNNLWFLHQGMHIAFNIVKTTNERSLSLMKKASFSVNLFSACNKNLISNLQPLKTRKNRVIPTVHDFITGTPIYSEKLFLFVYQLNKLKRRAKYIKKLNGDICTVLSSYLGLACDHIVNLYMIYLYIVQYSS